MLTAALPAFIFAVALTALHRMRADLRLHEILGEFRAIDTWQIVAAIALAGASYLALTLYERLALSYVGVRLPWRQYALTSFISYAIGNNVGIGAISGAAVRYRLYSSLGIRGGDIGAIVAFCTVTLALGIATLAGLSLLAHAGEAATLLHASSAISTSIGVVLLGAVLLYLGACSVRRTPLLWRGWRLPLPPARIAFVAFAGLYMVAVAISIASAVPGGLGVFESIMVLLLPRVPPAQLLGALLAYRLVYYVLPFAVALALLTAREAARQGARLEVAVAWTRKSLDLVVPQAMAVLAFGAGCVLLLSGATPGTASRLAALDRIVPLPVLELSHLAGSAAGVLLLVLARGLLRRLDGAWHATMWLLGAGIAASLLKGLDYEEAILLVLAALALWWTRDQFYRKASLLAERLTPGWMASVAVAIGASIWVGLLAYRHVPYASELWWQFALDAHAPRMLRASLLAVLVLGVVAVWRLLAPARAATAVPPQADLARALPIIRASTESAAHLALLGDKSLLFSQSGRAFLMHAVSGRSWIAMGDPVGPPEEREELVWRFRELADQAGAWSVFYEVSADQLATYVDAGLALSKLGEEARVRLDDFSLTGGARAELRQAHRRAGRDGLGFRIAPAAQVPALLPELRRVSDDWLQSKSATEKGFSLGRFSAAYLAYFPVALVECRGEIVGFANLWETETREELSVDLMRHTASAPRGVMDFLFVELMLWGRAQGYRWFNLGMAPLAGLEQHRLAPMWHKAGRLVFRYGEEFYNFAGLRQYKDKFLPEWRPRYLAAPGRLALPRVLFDVTELISGRREPRPPAAAAVGAAYATPDARVEQ
jgi:phosphatidylglycerol lysyltransferase